MDRSSLSSVNGSQIPWARSAIWPAVTSALLVTGFTSNAPDRGVPRNIGKPDRVGRASGLVSHGSNERAVLPIRIAASHLVVDAKNIPVPTIDLASFNERFAGKPDSDTLSVNLPYIDCAGVEFDNVHPELPGEADGSRGARREGSVLPPNGVFSFVPGTARPAIGLTSDPHADADRPSREPPPELLSGIPEHYAALALATAEEERVDPNWVLSIMRAENAEFDPGLISSAGAIGLMQVMPQIGEAFGAHDLTDPEQNIRAGTRFLRLLIEKYHNPVLIAAAYNAGEPRVDVHRSLPLIRETADYVTRVVGYYTSAAMTSQAPTPGPSSRSEPNRPRRTGPTERAKSPMLVFSVPDPLASDVRVRRTNEAAQFSGPIKIVKEKVLQ